MKENESGGTTYVYTLDTDYWDVLAKMVFVLNPDSDNYEKNQLVPTLEKGEIESNKVKLNLEITDPNGLTEPEERKCVVYKSETEDGLYRRITEDPISCSEITTIIDEDVEPNSTYYYKTRLVYTITYSPVLEVTTSEEVVEEPTTNTTDDNEEPENTTDEETTNPIVNPKTGDNINLLVGIMSLLAVVIAIAIKRINKLNNAK